MSKLKKFLAIWLIGTIASMCPLGYFGLMFGAPAVFISSVAVTLLLIKTGDIK